MEVATSKMTPQIYNAISKTELELMTFRGNVVRESDTLYEVEWHLDEKKIKVELLYVPWTWATCTSDDAADKGWREDGLTFLKK